MLLGRALVRIVFLGLQGNGSRIAPLGEQKDRMCDYCSPSGFLFPSILPFSLELAATSEVDPYRASAAAQKASYTRG